jgi:hypothetical protein
LGPVMGKWPWEGGALIQYVTHIYIYIYIYINYYIQTIYKIAFQDSSTWPSRGPEGGSEATRVTAREGRVAREGAREGCEALRASRGPDGAHNRMRRTGSGRNHMRFCAESHALRVTVCHSPGTACRSHPFCDGVEDHVRACCARVVGGGI